MIALNAKASSPESNTCAYNLYECENYELILGVGLMIVHRSIFLDKGEDLFVDPTSGQQKSH
jgi:hypothetical protein